MARSASCTWFRTRAVELAVCACVALQPAAAAAPRVLPITMHVAERAGQPVVSPEWVTERVARASEIFGVYGVQFEVVARRPLAERHAALETRADRDALGQYFERGTIHVFCVESLMDVDEPGRVRRGVHWRSTTHPGAHFVVVSQISGAAVLAHELGHYLGNPQHSEVPGNLMSYEHTEVLPFLDAKQQQRMRRAIARYSSSGELRPLSHPAHP